MDCLEVCLKVCLEVCPVGTGGSLGEAGGTDPPRRYFAPRMRSAASASRRSSKLRFSVPMIW